MSALTENRYTKHRDGLVTAHPVKADTKIFKGGLVCADATGYGVPGDDALNYTFLGVALESADNTGGADGAVSVRVQTMGVFSFAKSGAVTIADVGSALYIVDDQTVALAATTTNDIACGKLEGIDGSDLWVRISV